MRAGTVSKTARRPFAPRIAAPAGRGGNGLGDSLFEKQAAAPASASTPAQLELPFGIEAASNVPPGQARFPRGARHQ